MIRYVFGINPDKTTNRTIYGGKLTVNARIYRGAPGEYGAGIQTVNNVSPDGNGNVALTADSIPESVSRFWLTDVLKAGYDGAVAWITTNGANLLAHLTNTSNPHNTTAAQVGAPSGSGTSTGTNTGDQDLSGLQEKSIVVAANTNAVNDGNYTNVANAAYTDPSPVEGKGFRVMVRNATATVGGVGYSTPGTVILRIFHSGSWANYVYQVAGERRHDFTAPYSYMAYAQKGSADSAAVWVITQINVAADGTTTKGTATGAWTNRYSLTYI